MARPAPHPQVLRCRRGCSHAPASPDEEPKMTQSQDPFAALSDRLAALTAQAAVRTVAVHGRDGRARSGLLWAEGLVVTAEEALERDDELALTLPDGRQVPATLAGRDPGTDVALLRAETGPVPEITAAPTAGIAPGRLVLARGGGEYGPVAAQAM